MDKDMTTATTDFVFGSPEVSKETEPLDTVRAGILAFV